MGWPLIYQSHWNGGVVIIWKCLTMSIQLKYSNCNLVGCFVLCFCTAADISQTGLCRKFLHGKLVCVCRVLRWSGAESCISSRYSSRLCLKLSWKARHWKNATLQWLELPTTGLMFSLARCVANTVLSLRKFSLCTASYCNQIYSSDIGWHIKSTLLDRNSKDASVSWEPRNIWWSDLNSAKSFRSD